MRFRDRAEAGRQLAEHVALARPPTPVVVLGLPRGGVPVAAQVAAALDSPLDVFVARKIGAPGHEEYGIGAVAEGYAGIVGAEAAARFGIGPDQLEELAARARQELRRRVEAYRQGRPLPELTGRTVVLVDDGIATGVTAEAALCALREHQPRRLVLAVPVCARETLDRLTGVADEVSCLAAPSDFRAVGQWYEHFEQTTDAEVLELLATPP